jgi:hypothetical protein
MHVDLLVEPVGVEDKFLRVRFWSSAHGRHLECRAEPPQRVALEDAAQACREGRLVLVQGHGRLAWARP